MAAALRRLGFDYVFDTDFTADLTIMEEGMSGTAVDTGAYSIWKKEPTLSCSEVIA
jgi:iron only hydrogenase large subunit-like protein